MQEIDATALDHSAGKYLTFQLSHEEYGIEILKVKEIIGLMKLTEIPRMPMYMKGVINLRGKVIPVVDLRLKFNMKTVEHTAKTCIIVVESQNDDFEKQIGVIVDSVSEVVNLTAEDIEPTPEFGVSINTDFIKGMSRDQDTVRTLLRIDEVLGMVDHEKIAV